jgi:hypothetical protein
MPLLGWNFFLFFFTGAAAVVAAGFVIVLKSEQNQAFGLDSELPKISTISV